MEYDIWARDGNKLGTLSGKEVSEYRQPGDNDIFTAAVEQSN